MTRFTTDSPVAGRTGFRQTVTLSDGSEPVATATWQHLPGLTGVYQLLWVEVEKDQRRRGTGGAVLGEVIRESRRHAAGLRVPLRRLMALVGQREVKARTWLVSHGFVHVHTLEELDDDQETLVMVRTFD